VLDDAAKARMVVFVVIGGVGSSHETRDLLKGPCKEAMTALMQSEEFKVTFAHIGVALQRGLLTRADLPMCVDAHSADREHLPMIIRDGLNAKCPGLKQHIPHVPPVSE
jgi:hypothetical protein